MSLDNLPVEWFETTLEQIAEWGSGGTPSRKNSSYYGGDVPWIKTGDLGEKYVTQATEFITDEAVKNSSAKFFKKGSVIMAMYGATIGKTSILGVDATTNQACAVGTPIATSTEFLYYFLRNEKNSFIAKGKGGAQPNISQQIIKAHTIYLPSLAEQQEIVRQLDSMLAQVEQIKARLDAIPAILKKFRQSVLADAVSGKLTEEWRGKAKEWESTTLAECTHRIGDGLHGTPQYVENGEYHFVNGNNLIDGEIVIKESTKSVNSLEFEKHKRDLGENTLLLSINGTIGNLAFYQNEKIILGKSACYLNFNEKMNRDFGYILLSSEFFIQYAHEVATGATIKNVPLKGVRNYQFLLPSLEEQVEIVAKVKQLLALGSTIEQKIEVAQKRVNLLTQSILAKAFSGELTTEWREQHQELITGINSAESLLAAIQAEREASKPVKKAKKVK